MTLFALGGPCFFTGLCLFPVTRLTVLHDLPFFEFTLLPIHFYCARVLWKQAVADSTVSEDRLMNGMGERDVSSFSPGQNHFFGTLVIRCR